MGVIKSYNASHDQYLRQMAAAYTTDDNAYTWILKESDRLRTAAAEWQALAEERLAALELVDAHLCVTTFAEITKGVAGAFRIINATLARTTPADALAAHDATVRVKGRQEAAGVVAEAKKALDLMKYLVRDSSAAQADEIITRTLNAVAAWEAAQK